MSMTGKRVNIVAKSQPGVAHPVYAVVPRLFNDSANDVIEIGTPKAPRSNRQVGRSGAEQSLPYVEGDTQPIPEYWNAASQWLPAMERAVDYARRRGYVQLEFSQVGPILSEAPQRDTEIGDDAYVNGGAPHVVWAVTAQGSKVSLGQVWLETGDTQLRQAKTENRLTKELCYLIDRTFVSR
jgi:hypothetical protein